MPETLPPLLEALGVVPDIVDVLVLVTVPLRRLDGPALTGREGTLGVESAFLKLLLKLFDDDVGAAEGAGVDEGAGLEIEGAELPLGGPGGVGVSWSGFSLLLPKRRLTLPTLVLSDFVSSAASPKPYNYQSWD